MHICYFFKDDMEQDFIDLLFLDLTNLEKMESLSALN